MSSNGPASDNTSADEGKRPPTSNDTDNGSMETEETTPVQRSDRYTTSTVSEQKWIELMNRADPLEQRIRTKKRFEQTEPPAESIKAYQEKTHYYLLNRGSGCIDRLCYRAYEIEVNVRRTEESQLYEVRDFPPKSFFQIGEMDLPDRRRMAFTLVFAKWSDGHVFEAEDQNGGHSLKLFDPADPIPSLDELRLSPASIEPIPVDS